MMATTVRAPRSPTVAERARTAGPLAVALVALAAGTLVVGLRLAAHGGEATAFARFGSNHVVADEAPDGAVIGEGTGYDGQYFYRIARDPTSRAERVDGVDLDRPAFRTRRIAYPAAAWALALGGRQALVPWTLIAVNLGALAALAGGMATAARLGGRSPWWGLLAAAWPGFLVALLGDLSELSMAAAVAWALVAMRRRRWRAAAALLTLAVLTRESAAVIAAAVAAGPVLARWRPARSLRVADRLPPAWVGVVPLAVLAGWLVAVRQWWAGRESVDAMSQTADQFGVPLLGPLRQVVDFLGQLPESVAAYQLLQFLVVLFVIALCALALRHRDAGLPHERLALVGSLAATLTLITWDRAVVFLRYPNEIVLLGVLLVAGAGGEDARSLRAAVPALLVMALPVWITIT